MRTRTITATLAALATAAVIGAGTATPAAAFKACQVTDTGGVDDKGFNRPVNGYSCSYDINGLVET